MFYFFRSLLIVAVVILTGISSAKAEIFYWQDPHTKLSVAVPDTWAMSHDQKTDDIVTFYAPGQRDFASCRVRARQDKRFVVYPQPRFSAQVQRLNYSRDFWEGYIGEYDEAHLQSVTDNAGLGRGFASFAKASYVPSAGPKMHKRAIMFVSLYNDTAYIVECSAETHAYDRWHNTFLSIVKSVDFRKMSPAPSGHYRNFMNDRGIRIHGLREIDRYYY